MLAIILAGLGAVLCIASTFLFSSANTQAVALAFQKLETRDGDLTLQGGEPLTSWDDGQGIERSRRTATILAVLGIVCLLTALVLRYQ